MSIFLDLARIFTIAGIVASVMVLWQMLHRKSPQRPSDETISPTTSKQTAHIQYQELPGERAHIRAHRVPTNTLEQPALYCEQAGTCTASIVIWNCLRTDGTPIPGCMGHVRRGCTNIIERPANVCQETSPGTTTEGV